MCGIFGVMIGKEARLGLRDLDALLSRLFLLSESRGKEAAGLAVRRGDSLRVHRQAVAASAMLRSKAYRDFLAEAVGPDEPPAGLAVIGHSRLVTNGSQLRDENNQPCAAEGLAVVHNGIIVNDADLWHRFPELARRSEVDTEVLLRLIARYAGEGADLPAATAKAFGLVEGSASIALLAAGRDALLLASNTGSLYHAVSGGVALFASERYILEAALEAAPPGDAARMDGEGIRQVKPGTGRLLDSNGLLGTGFGLDAYPEPTPSDRRGNFGVSGVGTGAAPSAAPWLGLPKLRRCARCILPETMPFVDYDAAGVCRYCREHRKLEFRGRSALEDALARFRRSDGSPDCIVALSGGRDSSFGLHYLKKEMGMHPIAYSYDWGMVTDLGRRNQARMCGRLGVEHILVSADIRRKRENIRKNVAAWMRKPHLGMIPLLMAGDKQFFYHANRLRKLTGLQLVIFCESPLEKTNFKTGFLGVREGGNRLYDMPLLEKCRLNFAYMREFLRNPAYLNRSLVDTALAFGSAYMLRHDYLFLFQYIPWMEKDIDGALLNEYGWETSPDTPSTWRIGDGTAAFYNFIYFTVAGFTEFDTHRSNQIREGHITRAEALERIAEENKPRWPSMREYAALAGFDLDAAVRVVAAMPKLYGGPGGGG
jgi:glucosamine--fructose-6-phosphate aminotransferase (isomerizing)